MQVLLLISTGITSCRPPWSPPGLLHMSPGPHPSQSFLCKQVDGFFFTCKSDGVTSLNHPEDKVQVWVLGFLDPVWFSFSLLSSSSLTTCHRIQGFRTQYFFSISKSHLVSSSLGWSPFSSPADPLDSLANSYSSLNPQVWGHFFQVAFPDLSSLGRDILCSQYTLILTALIDFKLFFQNVLEIHKKQKVDMLTILFI